MNVVPLFITSTPRNYKDIVSTFDGEFHGVTAAGTDFFVKVKLADRATTNDLAMRESRERLLSTEQAVMAERIRQAAEARGRGGPAAAGAHGVVADTGASIDVLIMHGTERFTSKIKVNTDSSYVDAATNRRHRDLRDAISHTMEVFEARKGIGATPAYARARVEAPTIGQMRR
ncbi:hypothetical protein [Rhizobium leguminosarum]|jgi:hypothetical protein|uniref:hypothetical protein n=1 Tax=Rhizobium leguminosarum TaxID=384 RepID=UPI002E10F2DA|nr:hypothetical protein U8Q02_43055 [Rhizobium leguminosarum]